MMKKIVSIFLPGLIWAGMVISCSNVVDERQPHPEKAYLQIEAVVEGMSRAILDTTSFSEGDKMGVFVRDEDGNAYTTDIVCSNLSAVYREGHWTLDMPIPLDDGKDAVVYAYFPYNAATEWAGDWIDIDVKKQEDLLYGGVTGVNAENPVANICFKHALSRLTFSIARSVEDVGDGCLTHVGVKNGEKVLDDAVDPMQIGWSDYISRYGKMSLADGSIRRVTDEEATVSCEGVWPLTMEQRTTIDLLILPCGSEEQEDSTISSSAVVTLTVDGCDYSLRISRPDWRAGRQYVYPITFRRGESVNVE